MHAAVRSLEDVQAWSAVPMQIHSCDDAPPRPRVLARQAPLARPTTLSAVTLCKSHVRGYLALLSSRLVWIAECCRVLACAQVKTLKWRTKCRVCCRCCSITTGARCAVTLIRLIHQVRSDRQAADDLMAMESGQLEEFWMPTSTVFLRQLDTGLHLDTDPSHPGAMVFRAVGMRGLHLFRMRRTTLETIEDAQGLGCC